jgi:hypothetical protein
MCPVKRFILRRVGYALLSLALLSVTIFLFVRLTGDPAVLLVEPGASKGDLEAVRKQLGLGPVPLGPVCELHVRPLPRQSRQSFYYRTPVLELYLSRLRELPPARRRGHGHLAPHRHPHRHHRGRPRQSMVGQRWESFCPPSACRSPRSGSAS